MIVTGDGREVPVFGRGVHGRASEDMPVQRVGEDRGSLTVLQGQGETLRMTQSTVGLASLAILTVGCLSVTAQQPQKRSAANARMSGTYQLESTRGDDPQRAADIATRSVPPGQRDRAYQSLLSRLQPPQTSRSIATAVALPSRRRAAPARSSTPTAGHGVSADPTARWSTRAPKSVATG